MSATFYGGKPLQTCQRRVVAKLWIQIVNLSVGLAGELHLVRRRILEIFSLPGNRADVLIRRDVFRLGDYVIFF